MAAKKYKKFAWLLLMAPVMLGHAAAQQIGGGSCSNSTLNGTYSFTFTTRQVSVTGFAAVSDGVGTATFDGNGQVTIIATTNTNRGAGTSPQTVTGTYSLNSNCTGTVTGVISGISGILSLIVYSQGSAFIVTGSSGMTLISGNGTVQPTAACQVNTLSGTYVFSGNGYNIAGGSVTAPIDAAGYFTFDGNGGVSGSLTAYAGGTALPSAPLTGTYMVNSNCSVSATAKDPLGNTYQGTFTITGANAATIDFIVANSQTIFSGSAHQVATPAQVQAGMGTCSNSILNATYAFTETGRQFTATGFGKVFQAAGTATFDGNGHISLSYSDVSNSGLSSPLTATGTYSLNSNCTGMATLTAAPAGAGNFTLLAYGQGSNVILSGTDSTYLLTGNGGMQPAAGCSTSTLSGTFVGTGSGYGFSSGSVATFLNAALTFTFDGNGNLTGTLTDYVGGAPVQMLTEVGTYAVGQSCTATAMLKDNMGVTHQGVLSVTGVNAGNVDFVLGSATETISGTVHAAFLNPELAVVNAASFRSASTPSGSVFSIFGQNFTVGNSKGQAATTPLPTTLAGVSVTVNGIAAPLFYVDSGQINAQLPVEVKPGLATVVVKTTNTAGGTPVTTNAVAVLVPEETPGISTYGSNRAVVVNQDGSVNAAGAPAHVGDTVVMYFTGGGPVTPASALLTGKPAPSAATVTGSVNITVGGQAVANVPYVGLTPGSIGLYQANFVIPSIAPGTYPVVLTINGVASNAPVITIR